MMKSGERHCLLVIATFLGLTGMGWTQVPLEGRPGSIRWYAEEAKQKGDTSVTIHSPMGVHEEIRSLDQALATYHVVIGVPIESLIQFVDANHIYTLCLRSMFLSF